MAVRGRENRHGAPSRPGSARVGTRHCQDVAKRSGVAHNRDGIVSLQELYEYVESEVTRTCRALGGNQHPVLKGELEGVLPLVKVSAPRP